MPHFSKKERLKSKKQIESLVKTGKVIKRGSLRVIWKSRRADDSELLTKVAFSVSKKLFKKAVQRNRIKRILRETYRLNKTVLYDKKQSKKMFLMLFVYTGKEELSFAGANELMKNLLQEISIEEGSNKPKE